VYILDESGSALLDESDSFILDESGDESNLPYYTYNFCPNPSFEAGIAGVSAVLGASVLHDPSLFQNGSYSLRVTTPGNQSGEGVILPPGVALATSDGSVSFSIQANQPGDTGFLNVYVYDTTVGSSIGSTTVFFDDTTSWQTISVVDLSLVNGDSIAVYIETQFPQATSFNIDSVQYEPATALNNGILPTPYIDGDLMFGSWVGAPEASASSKPFQFQIGDSGGITTQGAGSFLVIGESFPLVFTDPTAGPTRITGQIDLSGVPQTWIDGPYTGPGGSVSVPSFTVVAMLAGLNDFSMFLSGDVDPAQSLVGWNNTGVTTGTNTSGSAGYTRPFATFTAPRTRVGNAGTNVWNAASYFAVGYEFTSMANNTAQNISHVQSELVPWTPGNQVVPSAYIRPRALSAVIAPTMSNYIANPSFETDTTGWTAAPGATISRQTSQHFVGSASLFNTGTSTQIGCYVTVPDLIVGEVYTVSAMAIHTDGTNPRFLTCAVNPTITLASATSEVVAISSTGWTQVDVQFVAPTSNVVIAFWAADSLTSPTSTTMDWYLDAVMLNPGGLESYGDGSMTCWAWEGTANESRSYFYERGNIAYSVVNKVLANNLPLGLHAYDPVYFQPVTQFTP
jgi:hypothetical protein